ncbi:hypothetical protein Esi_0005_0275 [Ectocarpus siliculosus]|uniref:Uncharacterized protein n=1 Tax=Ectocarpus siliculosus TaxID=2880 RepID=D8LNX8_ECTSI|nr:hypothetical protein Esi_0005_0275 [Ectocarpus siliculosus]|eukprot:CBN78338.1 hypothetical protein Esi_0005_0275 [Ectocarpus siliculosus]
MAPRALVAAEVPGLAMDSKKELEGEARLIPQKELSARRPGVARGEGTFLAQRRRRRRRRQRRQRRRRNRRDDRGQGRRSVGSFSLGYSSNSGCHRATSAGGTWPQELECLARSAVAEGEDIGFRRQYEAWDEFVYGSYVLFQEGYRRPQQCALDLRQQGGHDGGGTATGGPIVRTPCSDWEGTDAPALCESIGNDSARLGGGSLSDVGRTRSLTVLAECFRQDTRYGSEGKTKIKRTPKAG